MKEPIQLHPENPHYFLWSGKPTVLIGSGEHYGAVLNRPFDYQKYLDTLQRQELNHTRLFLGLYVEDNGHLSDGPQAGNSLDPAPGQLICPFARSDVPGYGKGGNKFDLKRWDEAFFARLKDFVGQAAARGVVVEINLFCPYYEDRQWKLSPFNAANNVDGLGRCERTEVFTLDRHDGLLAVQEAMVRRVASELRDFDNLYYEICNEPYCGGITQAWQNHIADVISDAEKDVPHKHLISQNIANHIGKVENPHPGVSIFNFHYAWPPDVVAMNYALNRPIGDNETGFRGTGDFPYRREAWEFILAGGALFDHLDYSFTVGHEDGSFVNPPGQWGGGSPELREQLRCLKNFVHSFDFVHMKPDNGVIRGGTVSGSLTGGAMQFSARAMAEQGRQYAIYVAGSTAVAVEMNLPAGDYTAQWLHPRTGRVEPPATFSHPGGVRCFESPSHEEDIAMSILRKDAR